MAVNYNIGLKGTAESVLRLGPLGDVTVSGINLNVVSNLDGLQGLKDVKFINLVQMSLGGNEDSGAIVLVSMNNPSKLTLKIGDLQLKTGLSFDAKDYGAVSILGGLELKPGANDLLAYTRLDMSTEVGQALGNMFSSFVPITLYLYPYEQSSKNEALNAGLRSLRQILELPPGLFGDVGAKPFGLDWTIKVPESAAQDGIFTATTTVGNPYFNAAIDVVSWDGVGHDPNADATVFTLFRNNGAGVGLFGVVPGQGYKLASNETKELTIQCKITATGELGVQMDDFISQALATGKIRASVHMFMALKIGSDPRVVVPYMGSDSVYVEPPDYIEQFLSLKVGPDFAILKTYTDNMMLPRPVAPPAEVTTAPTTLPPSPTVATPSPTTDAPTVPVTTATTDAPAVTTTEEPAATTAPSAPSPSPTTA
ncbi:hypothetical protein BG004_002693 [Podila humilis]|nr:hypothetical protein BG004_002693 [Podila humilis]